MSRARSARMRRDQIGMVFQSAELIGSLTGVQNVMLPALIGNEKRKVDAEVVERVERLLEAVGFTDYGMLAAAE